MSEGPPEEKKEAPPATAGPKDLGDDPSSIYLRSDHRGKQGQGGGPVERIRELVKWENRK
jgi:hypothetical protein